MFDPSNLLQSLLSGALSGKKKKKRHGSFGVGSLLNNKTLLLGLGAAGAAYLAHQHFNKDKQPAGGTGTGNAGPFPPQGNNSLPPPPTSFTQPSAATMPPPLPGTAAVAPPPLPPMPGAAPSPQGTASAFLIRAMIAAANADHEIDGEERARILAKSELLALGDEERAALQGELSRPLPLHTIVEESRRHNVTPRQVYAASFLAILPDTDAERAYLRRLAEALGMTPADAAEVEGVVAAE